MNIPNRQFELRQQPPFTIYVLTFFSIFFVSAMIGMFLSVLLQSFIGMFSLLFFPFGPPFLASLASFWLLAPCVVNLDANGFSIQVKRSSIRIPLSKHTWTWNKLSSFEFYTSRNGAFLILEVNGVPLIFRPGKIFSDIFSGDELREMKKLLCEYFPEKEKKSFL